MRERLLYLVVGGALVMGGYVIGSSGTANPAMAQADPAAPSPTRVLRFGEPIYTWDDDGRILRVWSTDPRDTQFLNRPTYIGEVRRRR